MPLKSYKVMVKTSEHPNAGTKAEVCIRFIGSKRKTEWLLWANHPNADVRADLCRGSTVSAMVKLPDLGEVKTCCVVLRGPSPEEWHPQFVDISDEHKSYRWQMAGIIANDRPVAWNSPAVLVRPCPMPLEAWDASILADAEERMTRFKSEWEVGSPNSVTPRQAVAEILAILSRSSLQQQGGPES